MTRHLGFRGLLAVTVERKGAAMMELIGDLIRGNEEIEALELGHRATGWVALADLYPDSVQDPTSPWYVGAPWHPGGAR